MITDRFRRRSPMLCTIFLDPSVRCLGGLGERGAVRGRQVSCGCGRAGAVAEVEPACRRTRRHCQEFRSDVTRQEDAIFF